ncbi:MAG TPA: hypothetical protein VMB72_09965, partial [Acidimicrobiales bacterium]|nr:hypothetical protein [Acidimicrobiales bacterium]
YGNDVHGGMLLGQWISGASFADWDDLERQVVQKLIEVQRGSTLCALVVGYDAGGSPGIRHIGNAQLAIGEQDEYCFAGWNRFAAAVAWRVAEQMAPDVGPEGRFHAVMARVIEDSNHILDGPHRGWLLRPDANPEPLP